MMRLIRWQRGRDWYQWGYYVILYRPNAGGWWMYCRNEFLGAPGNLQRAQMHVETHYGAEEFQSTRRERVLMFIKMITAVKFNPKEHLNNAKT